MDAKDTNNFRSLMGTVKSIKSPNTSSEFYPAKPTVSPEKRYIAETFQHATISQSRYDIGAEDTLTHRGEGIQKQLFKQLKEGKLPLSDSIDLHGMTTNEAEIYLATTIDGQHNPYSSVIRVVHGKGYNASIKGDAEQRMPILKNFTARYLSAHPRVLAYVSCPPHRGGTGAVYVLLRRGE